MKMQYLRTDNGRVCIPRVRYILEETQDSETIDLPQHPTIEWCSREEESTYCRNMPKYVARHECARKVPGLVC
jgi:hypothetical protein